MPYLQIFRNNSNPFYNYTVIKGNELYEVRVIEGEKMKWRYVGEIDPDVYKVDGVLIYKPSMQMISIFQKVLKPPVKEGFKSFKKWLK